METRRAPVRVHEHVAYFGIAPVPRKWGRLERLAFPTPEDDARWIVEHAWSWLPEVQVEVRLSVYAAEKQLYVGGVEVLTVPQAWEIPHAGPVTPPAVAPLALGTDVLRAIPLGELAKEAIRAAQDMDVARTALQEDDEALDRLRVVVTSSSEEAKPARGRPTNLTPQVLELVRDVYLRSGRTGVQAVQKALQEAGFPGAGADGVTRDQAAKAVATARRKGYLPPARKHSDGP
jgi:hypothetical protein